MVRYESLLFFEIAAGSIGLVGNKNDEIRLFR